MILVSDWPHGDAVLLDSNRRRAGFLAESVAQLGWSDRVRVVGARAEEAGRDPTLRGAFTLVVARSFGPPAVTAECAAPLLHVDGLLVVSEPPRPAQGAEADRWPAPGLAPLGLVPLGVWRGQFGYQILRQATPCPDRFPRRVGIPGKRPLY